MPASVKRQRRKGGPLLIALFWLGVALAPLAALLLLLAKGESALRIAAVLAVLAVVLIGLSITLRKDSETVRLELEETLLDEVDLLREDLRQDIGTAARATHRQFSEKLQSLYESVEGLRTHVEATRYGRVDGQASGQYAGQAHSSPAAHSGPAPHVGPAAHSGPAPHVGVGPTHTGPVHAGNGRAGAHTGSGGRAAHAGGVVRHTETVQVTTRQTIVDPHEAGRGTVYGGGSTYDTGNGYDSGRAYDTGNGYDSGRAYDTGGFGRSDSGPPPRAPRWGEPAEESWTEQRLRERLGQRAGESRGSEARGSEARSTNGANGASGEGRRSRAYDPDDEDSGGSAWSARRSGPGSVEDRWAAVRSDDRGRELRMGERRAALHAGESGTELRIEDRWASVRREEARGRRSAEDHRSDDRWGTDDDRWSDDRWGPEVEDTGRWGDRRAPAALPATSSEPTWSDWTDGRGTDGRGEGRRRRYRDDDDEPYSWQAESQDPPRRARERERWGG